MSVLLRTLGFCLALTLFFTLVANMLPQIEGEVPAELVVNTETMSVDEYISWGEALYFGKGNCNLCHLEEPAGRAPQLIESDMVVVSGLRLAAKNYRGGAKSAAGYLRESMLEPGRYVVPGWGKVGTNDLESPMPQANLPPTGLSLAEVDAVVVFLQAKDGYQVSVPSQQVVQTKTAAEEVAIDGPTVWKKYACASCHSIDTNAPGLGPSMLGVSERLSRAQIRQSIVEPNAEITSGFLPAMPADIAAAMSAAELNTLVEWLADK